MSIQGTKALQLWSQKVTKEYTNVNIVNMTTSWRNGLAFCAIIHYHCPQLIDYPCLNPDDVFKNNSLAFSTAENHLGIPALLDPLDMVQCELLDKLSILTYLAQLYHVFKNADKIIVSTRVVPSSVTSSLHNTGRQGRTVRQVQDLCEECSSTAFILERINIGGKILHRKCLKCSRCQNQLFLTSCFESGEGKVFCEECQEKEKTHRIRDQLSDIHGVSDREINQEIDNNEAHITIAKGLKDTDNDDIQDVALSDKSQMNNAAEFKSPLVDKFDEKKSLKDYGSYLLHGSDDERTEKVSLIKHELLVSKAENLASGLNANLKPIVKDIPVDDISSGVDKDIVRVESDDNEDALINSENKEEYCGDLSKDQNEAKIHVENTTKENFIPEKNNNLKIKAEVCEGDLNSVVYVEGSKLLVKYPAGKNPFGDSDDDSNNDVPEIMAREINGASDIIKPSSLNPFGSDFESEDEENTSGLNSISISIPLSHSLNPFDSDLDSEEDGPLVFQSPSQACQTTVLRPTRPAPPPPLVENMRRQSQILIEQNQCKIERKKCEGFNAPPHITVSATSNKIKQEDIDLELFDIEVKQGGLEKQGVKLEKAIRNAFSTQVTEDGLEDKIGIGPQAEDLIIQLCYMVSEKNELTKRQSELILMKKEQKLEKRQSQCEQQLRVMMSDQYHRRTDDDKVEEERLIAELVDIVAQRNEIVDSLELDRQNFADRESDNISGQTGVSKAIVTEILRKSKSDNVQGDAVVQYSQKKERKKSTTKKLKRFASKKLALLQKE